MRSEPSSRVAASLACALAHQLTQLQTHALEGQAAATASPCMPRLQLIVLPTAVWLTRASYAFQAGYPPPSLKRTPPPSSGPLPLIITAGGGGWRWGVQLPE